MKKIGLIFLFAVVFLCGCDKEVSVVKVNQEQAMEYIEEGALLIDVRSESEFDTGHIDGAINIDVNYILEIDSDLTYGNKSIGKNRKIIVYCRSGSRSNKAALRLIELGYTQVYDLGAIDNWSE